MEGWDGWVNGWMVGRNEGWVCGWMVSILWCDGVLQLYVLLVRTSLTVFLFLRSFDFFLLPSTFSLHPSFFIFQQGETVPMVANDAGSMLPRTMLARRLGERSLGIPRGVEGRTHVATRANNG